VDGANRNECVKACISKIKSDGLIIFDNTDDAKHDEGVKVLINQNFKRIDFYGMIPSYTYKNCTSLFFKGDKILVSNTLPSQKQSCLGRSCMQIINPSESLQHSRGY
jgi:hypothetical protein